MGSEGGRAVELHAQAACDVGDKPSPCKSAVCGGRAPRPVRIPGLVVCKHQRQPRAQVPVDVTVEDPAKCQSGVVGGCKRGTPSAHAGACSPAGAAAAVRRRSRCAHPDTQERMPPLPPRHPQPRSPHARVGGHKAQHHPGAGRHGGGVPQQRPALELIRGGVVVPRLGPSVGHHPEPVAVQVQRVLAWGVRRGGTAGRRCGRLAAGATPPPSVCPQTTSSGQPFDAPHIQPRHA